MLCCPSPGRTGYERLAGGGRAAGGPSPRPHALARSTPPWPPSFSSPCSGAPFDGTYDGFVGLSREIMRGRNTREQQQTVAQVLLGLLPPQAPERFRRWFPLNKVSGAGRRGGG